MTGPGINPPHTVPSGALSSTGIAAFSQTTQSEWQALINGGVETVFGPLTGLCQLLTELPFFGSLTTYGAGGGTHTGTGITGDMLSGVQTLIDFFVGGTGTTIPDIIGLLLNPLELFSLPFWQGILSAAAGLLPGLLNIGEGVLGFAANAGLTVAEGAITLPVQIGSQLIPAIIDTGEGVITDFASALQSFFGFAGTNKNVVSNQQTIIDAFAQPAGQPPNTTGTGIYNVNAGMNGLTGATAAAATVGAQLQANITASSNSGGFFTDVFGRIG